VFVWQTVVVEVWFMLKKIVLVVIILVLLMGGIFISMRRSHMMGSSSQSASSRLVAVSREGKPMPVPASAASLPGNTAIQESGGMLVSLALNPYPPSGTQASDFEVTLTDTSGNPLPGADISLDLTMPSMWMPPNQISLQPIQDGKYHASGHFTMRGMWRIEVIITRGADNQSVFFDVGL
jgi:hypothetical protein